MPSDVLSPPALTRVIEPRSDLLVPSHVVERRDATGRVAQRGVLGTLDVRGTESGHVLRHQRVTEAEVDRQSRLLSDRRAAGGPPAPSPDPLLLAAPDLDTFRECIELTSAGAPDAVLPTSDAGEVLLWTCDRRWSAAPPPLGPVLLADGHHRLEAARRIDRSRPARAPARLPALVVDHGNHPLTLTATHRVVPGLDPHRAAGAARRFARVRPRPRGTYPPPPRGSFLLTGAGRTWELAGISTSLLAGRLRRFPAEWAELDAAVSDHVLIPALCEEQGIDPTPRYTTRLPGPGEAGLVLPPPTWNQIWAGAASGAGMPTKSTCLGPKPLPGLLDHVG
ncbi:DUF1015 family protein [Streptomyces sp. ST2-7A]|uniref:DUF1015 family protein n=1 Tax=Streptomyces sp. ST2-7A TaxID=2907214 RepID=UPI001F2BD328|nr:DUF1015 family protein [Streptomyces sp. ST2-7A]MCE7082518.1 DUF1015 domain-containing protein [Streptomyces sp. ST2-7A]